MKIIYLGTPDFAIKPLERILNSDYKVVAVITQEDKKVGRKAVLTPPPLKVFAAAKGLKVLQFSKIRENVDELKSLNADIMITCAYGQILTQEIIDICKYGIINIHASLLPKYRGAAPIQWSIINGDKYTGVTIMKTEKGLDTGDIIIQEKLEILEDETAGELFDRLSNLSGDIILKALNLIANDRAIYLKQNELEATKVKTINKADALIDFRKSSKDIQNFVNGMNPWPVAFTYYKDELVKIYKVKVHDLFSTLELYNEGRIISADAKYGLKVRTGSGYIEILELQFAGGKRLKASEVLNGNKIKQGEKFGSKEQFEHFFDNIKGIK